MLSTDVLLSVPTESVAVRAIIASVAALVLIRLLLRAGLRLPRVRVAAVLVPSAALVGVALLSGRAGLPTIMRPVEAVNGLAIPVGDGYVHFAPLAWPILVGTWAAVALTRIALRLYRIRRTSRRTAEGFNLTTTAPGVVRATVTRVAAAFDIAPPPVALIDHCPGGAAVVGLRRPVLVIDRELAGRLDREELEGLVAHELSHVRRRDNLVSVAVGIARDLAFFVPGGRWVLRHLHAEREVAADASAVEFTGRPGALASGLLKVIETRRETDACAAFAPGASLSARVELLCADTPAPGRLRRALEPSLVVVALTASVAAAIQVPALVACDACEREALALLWAQAERAVPADVAPEPVAVEATAFDVYRRHALAASQEPDQAARPGIDDGRELNPAVLRGMADLVGFSPDTRRSLGMRPTPQVRIDEDLVDRWRAKPVLPTDDGLGVYWLSRVDIE